METKNSKANKHQERIKRFKQALVIISFNKNDESKDPDLSHLD